MPNAHGILNNLPDETIFNIIPGLVDVLHEEGVINFYKDETIIANAGDKLDHLIVPLQQHLTLHKGEKEFMLSKGRSLFLAGLIKDESLPYSVKATAGSSIIFISKESFLNLLENNENLHNYLLVMNDSASLRNLSRYLKGHKVPFQNIINVIGASKKLSEAIVDEGRGIYLIESGEISIKGKDEESLEIYETLSRGSFFGGMGVISPFEWSYQVDSKSSDLKLSLISTEDIKAGLQEDRYIDLILKDQYVLSKTSSINLESTLLPFKLNNERVFFPKETRNFIKNKNYISALLSNAVISCGGNVSLSSIESYISVYKSISPLKISTILESRGVISRPFFVEDLEAIDFTYAKLLIIIDNKEAGLIVHKQKDKYLMYTGDEELTKISLSDIRNLSIEALLLQKIEKENENVDKLKDSQKVARLIFNKFLRYIPRVRKVLMLDTLALFLSAQIPWFSKILIDEVLKTKDMITLKTCFLGIILFAITATILNYFKNRLMAILTIDLTVDVDKLIYHEALKIDQKKLNDHEVGGVINRIMETESIKSFFGVESINSLLGVTKVVLYLILVSIGDFRIALLALSLLFILFISQWYIRKKLRQINLKIFDDSGELKSFINDTINGIMTIKAFGMEKITSSLHQKLIVGVSKKELRASHLDSTYTALDTTITMLIRLGAIWLAIFYILTEKDTSKSPGELLQLTMYLSALILPLQSLFDFVNRYEDVKISLEKVAEIFFNESKNITESKSPKLLTGKLHLDRVSFKYPGAKDLILKDISMYIYPRQVIALVGKSGCGKTTLANLIAGIEKVASGKIIFDDEDSSYLDMNLVRSQIGYLRQESQLFAGSIKDNISYADDSPDSALLQMSTNMSNCNEFLSKFPQGMNTYLAQGGMGLSGGQKQRLAIARTLYSDPKILIFDEATSALDSNSEKMFLDNLKKMIQGRTAILIAHRLSTIKKADMIFVLDQGKIVDSGTFDELSESSQVFNDLFDSQMV